MMWRMTVELDAPVLGGATMFSAGTGDIKVVGYEIGAEARARGRSLFNWIAEVKLGEADAPAPEREDWNRAAAIEEFLPYFEDWRFDWLDVPALARASQQAWAFPMVDRDPVDRWSFGRVTLLGDAAHPMWPIGSNGASQAVLDCRALADALAANSDVHEALQIYEAERRPATAEVVRANRTRAHDRMLDLVAARAPHGYVDINDVIDRTELERIVSGYRHTAQFDQRQLRR
jgi:2-polyprenyl-6-methoxyphenol hydroxylase-like FAD-dependent oxidoreductase